MTSSNESESYTLLKLDASLASGEVGAYLWKSNHKLDALDYKTKPKFGRPDNLFCPTGPSKAHYVCLQHKSHEAEQWFFLC